MKASNYKTGGELLCKVLGAVSDEMRTKIVGEAVRVGGKLMADAITFNVPIRHGALRQSIGYRVKKYPKNGGAVAVVGPRRRHFYSTPDGIAKPTKYAHLMEFGFTDRGGVFVGPKKPFIRPAVTAVAPVLPGVMGDKMADMIVKTALKARRT